MVVSTDFKAVVLHLALDLMHKKTKTDLITGLKTRTKAGRPDWDELFQAIKKQDMGKVSCGCWMMNCGYSMMSIYFEIDHEEDGDAQRSR